jgi:hypothetical protein
MGRHCTVGVRSVSETEYSQGCTITTITLHYIIVCGTRSLMAMESRAIAGGLSADHQLPGVPKAKDGGTPEQTHSQPQH